jgi:putative aldouronate transport system permease protein
MIEGRNVTYRIVDVMIWFALIALALSTLLPFVHVAAKSVSWAPAVESNQVGLWPIGFTMANYIYLWGDQLFKGAFAISIARVLTGVTLQVLIAMLTGYALSRDKLNLPGLGAVKGLMLFSMLFSGGLIPVFLAYKTLGLLNHFAVLILPGAFNVFFAVLVANYFRGLPIELSESAFLDGASHFDVLFRIYMPLSLPSLATIALFSAVNHWNAWFDGIIFLRQTESWPLQSYLYSKVTSAIMLQTRQYDPELLRSMTPLALRAALIVMGAIPIMLVYPFLQRYFVHGLTLGALKG